MCVVTKFLQYNFHLTVEYTTLCNINRHFGVLLSAVLNIRGDKLIAQNLLNESKRAVWLKEK